MSAKETNLIDKLQKLYNEAVELNKESTKEFDEHKQYFHGDQLPSDVLAKLRARSQPAHWENIYQKIGNKIMGFKITTRKEVRVMGRQREDKGVAELLTDIFRTIFDKESFNVQQKQCDVDLLLGLGVFEVSVFDTGEKDDLGRAILEVIIEHIPSESFLIDPFSVKYDASDAKHLHKILLVIPIVPVTFCHDRIHFLKRSLYNIVHFRNLDLMHSEFFYLFFYKMTDKINIFL